MFKCSFLWYVWFNYLCLNPNHKYNTYIVAPPTSHHCVDFVSKWHYRFRMLVLPHREFCLNFHTVGGGENTWSIFTYCMTTVTSQRHSKIAQIAIFNFTFHHLQISWKRLSGYLLCEPQRQVHVAQCKWLIIMTRNFFVIMNITVLHYLFYF